MSDSQPRHQHPDLVSEVVAAVERAEADEHIDITIAEEQVDSQLAEYKDNRVADSSAVEHVAKAVLDQAGVDNPRQFLSGGGRQSPSAVPSTTIGEIGDHLYWFDLDTEGVTVIETYDSDSEKKVQTGYVADSSGKIRYTLWADAGIDALEHGEDYALSSVSLNEYQGEFEINIGSDSRVEPIEDGPQISPDEFVDEFEGCIVAFHDPTGLITRCQNPECERSLEYGVEKCIDCGAADVDDELLVKAVLDTGDDTVTAYFYREQVVELVDLTVEECKQKIEQHNLQVLRDEIEARLHGVFLTIRGSKRRSNFYVDDVEYVPAPTASDLTELVDELQQTP